MMRALDVKTRSTDTAICLAATAVAALLLSALLLAGCSDSAGPSVSGYHDATSPDEVLSNFGRAYNEQNVDEYVACLSEDFKFHFAESDLQDPNFDLPPWFYRADEQQVHENMFSDESNVAFTDLTLTPTSVETIPGVDAGRRTDDVVVIEAETELRVGLVGDVTLLVDGPQEFRFRVAAGDGRGDGRSQWKLFEWHELDERSPDPTSEYASWGLIKALYLDELSQQARRASPTEVIDQLRLAYVTMDLQNYLDCLSEDFIFYPAENDVHDPQNPLPPQWYKTDETQIHANMFDPQGNVDGILLTLTNTSVEHEPGDPQDPLDDVYVHREDVDLRVYVDGWFTYLATAPSKFHIRVDQDEEGPYGEVMWEIYEWYDDPIRSAADGREESSWGRVKSMYK
jgi:hypothetical protein